jgi:membrane-bound metal-dependent hydrolase YbcI (DUF457 family)
MFAGQWLKRFGQLCALVFVANLADLDFLPELLFGKNIHRGPSHGVLAAISVAILFAAVWRIAGTFWTSAGVYFVAYGSHLLIDFFTGLDLGWNHSASGIPFFWPWRRDFGSPLVLDYGVRHGNFAALTSVANLRAVCYDLCLYGTITALLLVGRARYVLKNPGKSASRGDNRLLQTAGAHQK